jgi:di/tricarboxylate transporter
MIDPVGPPAEWPPGLGLEPLPLTGNYFTDQSSDIGIAEVIITPESGLLGKSVRDRGFRTRYGLTVIGLRRGRAHLPAPVVDEKLKLGDTLLVIGPWKRIRQSQTGHRDFVLLSLPAEADEASPSRSRAPYALLSLGVMVLLMVTGLVPNVMAGLIGCLLMGAFRCLGMESAYRSIHWQSLVLIVGMIPFSTALEKTGGIELAATGLLHLVGDANPPLVLASLFVFTATIGLFISNTATAVLMAPIALSVAGHLGASPYPFAMTVALAASAAFMTPVSSPVNTLVMGPGKYRFSDFVKVGVPFTAIVLVITVVLVPRLFPLY